MSTSGVAASSSRLPTTKIADYEHCIKLLADKAHPVRGRGTLNSKTAAKLNFIKFFPILETPTGTTLSSRDSILNPTYQIFVRKYLKKDLLFQELWRRILKEIQPPMILE